MIGVSHRGPLFFSGVFLLETLDPSFGIDDLLRSGEEGMAMGANVHVDVADGRAGRKGISARAVNRRNPVSRVNSFFHAVASAE
jgi:hypothetical protein